MDIYNTVFQETVRSLPLWRTLEDNRTSNMIKSTRMVLNCWDLSVYSHETP